MLEIPEHYLTVAAKAGELIANIFGVVITAYGLKEIWTQSEQKKFGFWVKVNLSILYILHVAAIGLAAAVLFGVDIVSLPIATAIVSSTTLLKNAFDWFKDSHSIYQLYAALKNEQAQLDLDYAVFKKNLNLFIEANQTLLMKAFQFIENKYNKLSNFVKNMSQGNQKDTRSQIKEINEISALLEEQRDADPNDVGILEKDLAKIVTTSKRVIDLQNKVFLANHDVKSTRYNTHFSGVTAGVALLLCYPSNWLAATTLNPIMLGIGIAAGLSSVWGLYKRHIAEDQLLANENKEIHRLIEDSVVSVHQIKHPKVRSTLNQKLDTIINEFDSNKANRTRTMPILFSAKKDSDSEESEEKPLSHFVKLRRESMSDLHENTNEGVVTQALRHSI